MEIGHNVMHGQWDWMNDPQIHSSTWDWDTASTAEAWKHSHNYIHHTYTNIRGKDKDLGYEIMRIDPHQKWHPVYLFQPLYNVLLMAALRVGRRVPRHGPRGDPRAARSPRRTSLEDLKGIGGKARDQIVKDYIAWPLISGAREPALDVGLTLRSAAPPSKRGGGRLKRAAACAPRTSASRRAGHRRAERRPRRYESTLTANVAANMVRNLWSHAIIFCGHFPDQTYTFTQEETEDESRGAWYVRQLTGAANIEGGPLFHVVSGNLGYQVEHHLFPDMPSHAATRRSRRG